MSKLKPSFRKVLDVLISTTDWTSDKELPDGNGRKGMVRGDVLKEMSQAGLIEYGKEPTALKYGWRATDTGRERHAEDQQMRGKTKLSAAQQELLIMAGEADNRRATCNASYAPALKLKEMGFATSIEGRFGSHSIELTPEGIREYDVLVQQRSAP